MKRAFLSAVLLLIIPSPAFSEKLDLLGFTPGMPYEEVEAKVTQFRSCQQGMNIEGTESIVCDRKVNLSFSTSLTGTPVLLSVQLPIRTTDDEPTVLADISKQFDGKPVSKDVEVRSRESMEMSRGEHINYYYWTLPQGLELRYVPDRGILQPAPASGTLILQNAGLIQRHKDQMFHQSRRSVPRL